MALTEPCTNNEAEYEALIAGLELALKKGIRQIRVYGDSQLIISQVTGEYRVLKPELVKYHQKAVELTKEIPEITYEKISRATNGKADALARLAKELCDPEDTEVHVTIINRRPLVPYFGEEKDEDNAPDNQPECENSSELPAEAMTAQSKDEDWRQPFIDYFKHGYLPVYARANQETSSTFCLP